MKKIFLLSAILLLSACAPRQLKVVSYNIRLGVADDGPNSWDIRKDASPAMIKDIAPDIFGLQEAYRFQVDYMKETCPEYGAIGVGREDGVEEGEHMEIFYRKDRFELEDWGTFWLSETPEVPSMGWDAACMRTATWCRLKALRGGRRFYYVNTHLDHVGKLARRNGLSLIVDRIGSINPEGYPMVLTGDLNVVPTDSCLLSLEGRMLSARETAEVSDTLGSYNAWGYGRAEQIDYIYYSGFRKALSFRTVTDTFASRPFISDHYPVMAVLEF